jgi:hypothetical protein
MAQGAMDAHSANLQLLSNGCRAIACAVHLSDLINGNSRLPSLVHALRFRDLDTGLLPLQSKSRFASLEPRSWCTGAVFSGELFAIELV